MTVVALIRRLRDEYTAMPGLCLTEEQVQRLCDVGASISVSALRALVSAGFLQSIEDGTYRRAVALRKEAHMSPLREGDRNGTSRADEHSIERAIALMEAEYREMPGLALTPGQAGRLLGLDDRTCAIALGTLTRRRFLKQTSGGAYLRERQG